MTSRSSLRADTGVSNDEMDRRIHALAAREGIGGELVVRHVAPTAGPRARAAAADAVLDVLANGKPAAVDFLAYRTGLAGPTVANALAALAEQGKVVDAGSKARAKGSRQRLWMIAEAARR